MASLEAVEDAACSIYSFNTGEHEDRMQNFIRSHIVNILRPLADRVQELQAQYSHLSQDWSNMNDKTEQLKMDFDHTFVDLSSLKGTLGDVTTRLEKSETNMSNWYEAVYRVESMHEQSKHHHHVLRRDVDNAVASFEASQTKMIDTEAFIEKLQSNLEKNTAAIAEHEESVVQIFDHLKALRNGHSFMQKDLDSVTKACQRNEKAIAAMLQSADGRRAEDIANVTRLREQLEYMESIVADANRNLQKQYDQSHKNAADISKIKATLHAESGTLSRFEIFNKKLDENTDFLSQLTERVRVVEADLIMSQKNLELSQATTSESMQGLQKKHAKLDAVVQNLEEGQSKISHHGKKVDWSMAEHQKEFRRILERHDNIERELMPNLKAWRQDMHNRVESAATELRKARLALAEQQDFLKGKSGIEEMMARMTSEMQTVKEQLSSIGASQDAHRKSMVGLSRGIEDTYRQVVLGENGMVSPKVPATMSARTRPSSALAYSSPARPHRPTGSAPPTGRRAVETFTPERTC